MASLQLCLAAIQVPEDLLKLVRDKPAVRQWMTDKLQVTDLHHRAPLVRQQHQDHISPSLTACQYLAGSFNNPDAYPDAVVSVAGKGIHLHKLVVTCWPRDGDPCGNLAQTPWFWTTC